MTNSILARMLKRAGGLVEQAPDPDAEVAPETVKKVEEAVAEAVEPVVVAIENAKSIREAEEDDTSVNPPSVFVPKPEPKPAPVADDTENLPPEPITFRQARMISWLGMIHVEDKLVSIHMLTKDLAERETINASWDKALASECIDALTNGNPFKHPSGWTVYLNRAAYAKYRAQQAS